MVTKCHVYAIANGGSWSCLKAHWRTCRPLKCSLSMLQWPSSLISSFRSPALSACLHWTLVGRR